MADEVLIYVRVTGTAGEAWRPARALLHPGEVYEILDVSLQPGETGRFAAGDRVTCRPYELTDHDIVRVAHEKAPGSP
jgi:hypothetical protein